MTDTFPLALEWLGPIEGGYSDDPDDRGNWTGGAPGVGELKGTKYGISAKQYPEEDIKNLTKERAHELYRRDYWAHYHCDQLPPALGLCLFDAVVQHRPTTAVKMLQYAVGARADGFIGPQTINHASRAPQILAMREMLRRRLELYHDIVLGDSRQDKHLSGWFNRILRLQAFIHLNGLLREGYK